MHKATTYKHYQKTIYFIPNLFWLQSIKAQIQTVQPNKPTEKTLVFKEYHKEWKHVGTT